MLFLLSFLAFTSLLGLRKLFPPLIWRRRYAMRAVADNNLATGFVLLHHL